MGIKTNNSTLKTNRTLRTLNTENARLIEELKQREKERADCLRRIISAQECERQRIARELHDVTSQVLATLNVRLEALAATLGKNNPYVKTQLAEMENLLSSTSKEIHRLIRNLRPALLDDLGLEAAIRSCAHSTLDPAGVEVCLEVVGREKPLPQSVGITIFRIAQEAIANIASHAKAESAYISMEFKSRSIALLIEDDGMGFDPSHTFYNPDASCGAGLLGIKERVDLIGGTLTIDTGPGRGTRLRLEIPVNWEWKN